MYPGRRVMDQGSRISCQCDITSHRHARVCAWGRVPPVFPPPSSVVCLRTDSIINYYGYKKTPGDFSPRVGGKTFICDDRQRLFGRSICRQYPFRVVIGFQPNHSLACN